MGKVIRKQIQGMSWFMKTSLVLLLTLATTVFMYEGWYKPKTASADVQVLQAFPNTPTITAAAQTASGSFTVSNGSNRLLVVAVEADSGGTNAGSFTVQYGGQTLTQIVVSDVTQRRMSWLGYLDESKLALASGTTLAVTASPLVNTTPALRVYAATFQNADQSGAPINATYSLYNNNTTAAFTYSIAVPAGGYGIFAITANNATVPTITVDTGYTLTSMSAASANTNYSFCGAKAYAAAGNANPTITYPATVRGGIAAATIKPYVVTDSTPPTAGTVTVSPDQSGTYTSATPTITTVFTDAESAVSSCQYTTNNGTNWYAGTVSGTGPYTCTATPTGQAGFLTINMRATSAGGTGTATAIQRTVDSAPPTDGTLTVTPGDGSNGISWTTAYDAGFGLASYTLVYATGATAPATCSDGTPVNGGTFSAATLNTTHAGLTNGTQYSYRLCATDNNSQRSTGVTASGTPVADPTKVTSCTACHFKNGIADGTARNNPLGYFQGSHAVHAAGTNNYACSVCHVAPGLTEYDHTNRLVQMQSSISGGTYNKTSPFAPSNTFAPNTCGLTMCHGTLSPVWGSTGGTLCTKCHSDETATTSFKTTAQTTNSVNSTIHVSHLNRTHSISTAVIACSECHDIPATVNATGHIDSALPAEVPMNGANASKNVLRSFNSTNKQCTNVYCHSGRTIDWTATALNSTIADCSKCHDLPPTPGAGSHSSIPAAITTIAGLSACSSVSPATGCHPTIAAAPSTYANIFADKAKHIDGSVQGGSCTGCHIKTPTGSARMAITGQFTSSRNSHHYQGTAVVDGKVCYACHWEAAADGSATAYHQNGTSNAPVALVVWDTTTRPTTPSAATLQYYSSGGASASSRGAITKINRHCIGCHNDTNKNTQSFTLAGDTGTPSKYSWEGLSTAAGGFGAAQSIGSKYLSTTTTNWGKFAVANNVNNKQPQVKAFSAHGKADVNQRGWSTIIENWDATVSNYPNTSGSTNIVACFDCHNSHGSTTAQPANAVTSSYSSATGKYRGAILKNTEAGKGGYTVSYRSYTGGNPTAKNPYKTGAGLCFDCHNNANVGNSTSVGSATPWGYSATFGSSQMIHGYTDNPYFGKAGGVFAKGITYPYIGAGLTVNRGGHFSPSYPMTTTPNFKINGLCTPCHDPHGVSPAIAAGDQQYAVPMLKGTFVTSPYKQDAAPANTNESRGGGSEVPVQSVGSTPGYHIDQNTLGAGTAGKPATARYWTFTTDPKTLQTYTDSQFAGLCLKCHNKTDINNTTAASSANWKTMKRIHNSVSGWAATGGSNAGNVVHAYTCSKCHSSHNSNLPRLLVTNCLDAKHRGRVATGGATGLQTTTSGSRGAGLGRFAGGGSYGHTRAASTATNPGPWFFGVRQSSAQVTSANLITTRTCHEQPTAGGTWTTNGTTELWNTKSPW